MKAWLPILVDTLPESPVLALSTVRHLARAAVFGRDGELLAGGLGSPALLDQAAEEARLMAPGECRLIARPGGLTLERLEPEEKVTRFWRTTQRNSEGAWAAWLLTMPRIEGGALKLARHLISAFGPWTTPRLPEEFQDQWSLLPLKAGLSRLFIFGDDALARETAALAARAGLTVTWLTASPQSGPELREARLLGDFDLVDLDDWGRVTPEFLAELGVVRGVQAMVTTAAPDVCQALKDAAPAYLALAGEAEAGDGERPGLFPRPVTTSQMALGLVAEMLR